jgi:hypothetical protein
MSQLIFLAPSGGTVTLTNEDTASTINLTVPATNGTLLISDSSNNLTVNNLTVSGTATFSGTGQIYLPKGTTSQRAVSPVTGVIRYNTDDGGFYEGYQAGNWVKFTTVSETVYMVSYLLVAGGAGAINGVGAGGGAGGALNSTATLIVGTVYTMTIGGGGAVGSNGTNSTITGSGLTTITATGGSLGNASTYAGGTSGNSFAGGAGANPVGGGGGGATTSGLGNNGGTGLQVPTGYGGLSSTYVAGGYSGCRQGIGGTAGTSGLGYNSYGGSGDSYNIGAGIAGVAILVIPTARYTGTYTGSPTVAVSGANTTLTWTSTGTYTA